MTRDHRMSWDLISGRGEPYDLPFPDHWPPGRPEYVIVVDQLRDWQPGRPPSLAELLEPGPPAPVNQSPTWKPNHDRARA